MSCCLYPDKYFFDTTDTHSVSSTKTHSHTHISSVLRNTVSDGSWGHKNTAFGICPVKVGQRGNGVSGRENTEGQADKKATERKREERGRQRKAERMKEIQRGKEWDRFFLTTDAQSLRQNAPGENITQINAAVQSFSCLHRFLFHQVTKAFTQTAAQDYKTMHRCFYMPVFHAPFDYPKACSYSNINYINFDITTAIIQIELVEMYLINSIRDTQNMFKQPQSIHECAVMYTTTCSHLQLWAVQILNLKWHLINVLLLFKFACSLKKAFPLHFRTWDQIPI